MNAVPSSFFNLYHHQFVRAAVAIPEVRVADPSWNARKMLPLLQQAAQERALIVLFPELSLSSYTCDDLFHQGALLDACLESLGWLIQESTQQPIVAIVGCPLRMEQRVFNCAVVFSQGRILGIVPKTYLPNYREFYEQRYFGSADVLMLQTIDLLGQTDIPVGSALLFQHAQAPSLAFHVEICEDLWVPIPPSSYAAMAGAHLLFNLSASNITIGKAAYRHQLAGNQSARCLAAYLYSAAGTGESTTDMAWDGHALIYEDGTLLAESERFHYGPSLIFGDIDIERLAQERMRQNSFGASIARHKQEIARFRRILFDCPFPEEEHIPLKRHYERFPYVPSDPSVRDQRSYEAYQIQVQGLVKRLQSAGIQKVVLGISGGLDSTHALIVCARSMDLLGYPRKNILAYTMPGFATSERTLQQAHALMEAIGCMAHEIDIRPSCIQMLKDIGHPYAQGQALYDITFENVQAGERTSHLFRLANHHKALVIGTGDLSELALGWSTYGVGDHMSHYNVNASVPKTLIQYLIRWVAQTHQLDPNASKVLWRILDTEISPELVPSQQGEQPIQRSEDSVGPYELQDFHLYYILRFGYRVPKIAFLAWHTWSEVDRGLWPDMPESRRHAYDLLTIKKHLHTFLYRFFQISQFKRSCVPNAPKVGSGGSLSPRGEYRAPSDGEAAAWLSQVALIPDYPPKTHH